MKPKVYIETTVVSYLTSRSTRDLVVAARKQETEEWWESRRLHYECFVSELVLEEAGDGDPIAAERRLTAVEGIPLLDLTEPVYDLASRLVARHAVPEEFGEDALHIAIAAVHGIDYLVTWNFSHINNAEKRVDISRVVLECGYEPPEICSPEELAGA